MKEVGVDDSMCKIPELHCHKHNIRLKALKLFFYQWNTINTAVYIRLENLYSPSVRKKTVASPLVPVLLVRVWTIHQAIPAWEPHTYKWVNDWSCSYWWPYSKQTPTTKSSHLRSDLLDFSFSLDHSSTSLHSLLLCFLHRAVPTHSWDLHQHTRTPSETKVQQRRQTSLSANTVTLNQINRQQHSPSVFCCFELLPHSFIWRSEEDQAHICTWYDNLVHTSTSMWYYLG